MITLGILAALIVVLCLPFITSMGTKTETALSKVDSGF